MEDGNVPLQTRVTNISPDPVKKNGWKLHTESDDGGQHIYAGFDQVILAIPPAQAQALLESAATRWDLGIATHAVLELRFRTIPNRVVRRRVRAERLDGPASPQWTASLAEDVAEDLRRERAPTYRHAHHIVSMVINDQTRKHHNRQHHDHN